MTWMLRTKHNLKSSVAITALLASVLLTAGDGPLPAQSASPWQNQPSTATGDLRLHTFHSQVFGNTRQLRVLVPAEYDNPANRTRRYPVLYLNDGQDLFDVTTSVYNPMEWRVDETVAQLAAIGKILPLIVVGIDNAGRRERPHEYLPYPDSYLQPPEPNPQGKRYPEFLVDEVMPFINAHYRTLQDPNYTGLGGSSYGGLIAVYSVVEWPGVFGRLLIESPSLYVADGQIFRDAAKVTTWPERIYLGAGTNEVGQAPCKPEDAGKEQEVVSDVHRLEQLLREAGVEPKRIKVVVTPCARHNEEAWAARLPAAMEFLFGP
jgi:enterochelin esterase-like enzyme